MLRSGLIFLHPSDELYGADRVLLELTTAVPAGLPVQVWLPTDLAHPRAPLCAVLRARGVEVHHVDLPILRRANGSPRGLATLAGRAVRLALRLLRARPMIAYCTTSAAFVGAPIARLVRVPLVVGHLQEVWSSSDRRLLAAPASACHRLIAASRAVTAALPARLVGRTVIVANATPPPSRVLTLAGRGAALNFVVASRWSPRKGYATLLRAWDRVERPGQLTILGGPPPSGASVDVAALVAGLHCPESVEVVGEVDDVGAYLEASDVVVIPSDEPESFGLVAIEAFARGRPVVAAAGGGLLEIVDDGETGWLFPPGDVGGLTRVLGGLSRAEVNAAGTRARLSYETRFTIDTFAQRWRAAITCSGSGGS